MSRIKEAQGSLPTNVHSNQAKKNKVVRRICYFGLQSFLTMGAGVTAMVAPESVTVVQLTHDVFGSSANALLESAARIGPYMALASMVEGGLLSVAFYAAMCFLPENRTGSRPQHIA